MAFSERPMPSGPERRIVVIGAGPGGICTGIKLKQAGIENFVILEKGAGVGGTWFHNRYPGAACDVQSHLYSWSFEIKKNWVRPYATQPEILEYMEHCVAKYGLAPHLRLSTPVRGAYWDEECTLWRVVTEHGEEIVADVVISAVGMFNELNYPDIAGLSKFEGTTFHSARWDKSCDLDGKKVAVIGSAASAVQFVPEIAKTVGHLSLSSSDRPTGWVRGRTPPSALNSWRSSRPIRWRPASNGGRSGASSKASSPSRTPISCAEPRKQAATTSMSSTIPNFAAS